MALPSYFFPTEFEEIPAKFRNALADIDINLKTLLRHPALQSDVDAHVDALRDSRVLDSSAHSPDTITAFILGDMSSEVISGGERSAKSSTRNAKLHVQVAPVQPVNIPADDADEEKENVSVSSRRYPSRHRKLSVASESTKSKLSRGSRATRSTQSRKAKGGESKKDAAKRKVLEELVDRKQRENTESPKLNDLRSKNCEDPISTELDLNPVSSGEMEESVSSSRKTKVRIKATRKGRRGNAGTPTQSEERPEVGHGEALPVETPVIRKGRRKKTSKEKKKSGSAFVETSAETVELLPTPAKGPSPVEAIDIVTPAVPKGRRKKSTSSEKQHSTSASITTSEPSSNAVEEKAPVTKGLRKKITPRDKETVKLNLQAAENNSVTKAKQSIETGNKITERKFVPEETSGSERSLPIQETIRETVVEDSPSNGVKSSAPPSVDMMQIATKKPTVGAQQASRKASTKPPAIPKTRNSDPLKTPENEFKVDKDGKISASVVGKLQFFGANEPEVLDNERTKSSKPASAPKGNRLFTPGLVASGKRPPHGNMLRRPISATSVNGAKLASITPGLRRPLQLMKGIDKKVVDSASTSSFDISASLFPNDSSDAKKKISFASTSENGILEKSEERMSEVQSAPKNPTLPIEERLIPKSIFADPSPEPVKHKSNEEMRLFPKSMFSAPSPEPTKAKKVISFAPSVKTSTETAVQTDESISRTAKKRTVDGMDQEPSSPEIVKRPRLSGKSYTGKSATGKSALRERIESLRKKPGYKSYGTPASVAPATPAARSSGFNTHLSPLRTPSVYSHSSAVEPSRETTFQTSQVRPLREDFSEASPSMEPLRRSKGSPTKTVTESPGDVKPARRSVVAESDTSSSHIKVSPDHASMHNDESEMVVNNASPSPSVDNREEEQQPMNEDEDNVSVLSNLMTSVKSFMPSSAVGFFGYNAGKPEFSETEEQRAARKAEEHRLDSERREAEIMARRKAAQQLRHAEAEEKRRRAEVKRKEMAEQRRQKEEEHSRKEAQRLKRLREELDARKKKKLEEDRKRELRHKRVREHQQKVAAAEAKRRAEMDRKEMASRSQQAGKSGRKGMAGPSGAGSSKMPSSGMKSRPGGDAGRSTPGTQRELFKQRKKDGEVSSYEMSAERPYAEDISDDDSDDNSRRGKKIPEWARNTNVMKALETQVEDPDKTFARVHSVNLEDVFASTQNMKKRYRTRNSSGQWTRDRLTAREEMEYKKRAGFI